MASPQYGAPIPASARGDGGAETTSRLVKGLRQQACRARSSGGHHGGGGGGGGQRRALTARRHVALDALGLPETPQLPEDVRRNQAAARQRTEELQGIFASRHSSEFDALRMRLQALDAEEHTLRKTLASLQHELDEANTERRAKEGNVDSIPEGSSDDGTLSPRTESFPERKGKGRPPPLAEISEKLDLSIAASASSSTPPGAFVRRDTGLFTNQPNSARPSGYKESPMSPILSRRRAEARMREAAAAHDNSMTQMKGEMAEIEKRMHKQQIWMDQVNEQILQAEITKVQCRVRLDKAACRVKSLSKELSNAYEDVVALLEERLRVEDAKARNEALLDYLHNISESDLNNAMNFADNKAELVRLLECCRKSKACEEKFNAIIEESKQNEQFVAEVQSKCQELTRFINELMQEWTKVPASTKESVFSRLPRVIQTMMQQLLHPVSAMQVAQDGLAYISEEMKVYAEMLEKAHVYYKKQRRASQVVENMKAVSRNSWHLAPAKTTAA